MKSNSAVLFALAVAATAAACGPAIIHQVPNTVGQLTAPGEVSPITSRVLVTVKCSNCSSGTMANMEDFVAAELERRGLATVTAHSLIGVVSNRADFSIGGFGSSQSSGFLGGLLSAEGGKGAKTFWDLPPAQQNGLMQQAAVGGRADATVSAASYRNGVIPMEIQLRLGNGMHGERLYGVATCTSHWTPGNEQTNLVRNSEGTVKDATRCTLHYILGS